ncbi:hypothetical protein GGH13_003874 [Coemansia sp. S155-1]|nr:hypothetical protein GGH13_003874 [Coemansia sp. S155-1]
MVPSTNDFIDHVRQLIFKGEGSGEVLFKDAQDILKMLDLRVEGLYLKAALLTNMRLSLADMVDRMAVRYAVPDVAESNLPPPPAASEYVATTPPGTYALESTDSSSVTSSPALTHVSETPSPIAGRPAFCSPFPRRLYRPLVLQYSSSAAVDKGNVVDTHDKASPHYPPHKRPLLGMQEDVDDKRPRLDTQEDDDGICPRLCTQEGDDDDKCSRLGAQGDDDDKRPRLGTQGDDAADKRPPGGHDDKASPGAGTLDCKQSTQPHVGPSVTHGACLPVSHHSDTEHTGSEILCDSSGAEITQERLVKVFERFLFITLDILPVAYRLTYRCKLIPPNVNRREFILRLVKVDGFRYWRLKPKGSNSDASGGLNILQRDDPICKQRHHMIAQELSGEQKMGVTAPLLCCYLATLCYMQVGQLTGPILSELFTKATGQSLSSLAVITERGIQTMTDDQLADMVRKWLKDLCSYISTGDRMQYSLDMASKCYDAYTSVCHEGGGDGTRTDPRLTLVQEMLASNEFDSQLLLGISPSALERLYKSLVVLMFKDVDEATLRYLKLVSVRTHKKDR